MPAPTPTISHTLSRRPVPVYTPSLCHPLWALAVGGAVTASLAAQSVRFDTSMLRGLKAEVKSGLITLANPRPRDDSQATRRKLFRRLLAEPAAREPLAEIIDLKLAALERRYALTLDAPIRAAYRQRLMTLSAKDLEQVAMTRRVWRNYLLHTSTQFKFQKHFLQPAAAVGKLLLPDAAAIQTKESRKQRHRMLEFSGYRTEVRNALGQGEDPTTGKKATTGIPLPPLDRVRNYEEHLDHLHRTISVASSVAPFEAQNILINNAIKARFIDYEEAEFILFANEIRMLMGTIAWATDIAACAATRDHSKDRVDGKAKGHWSSIPGKRGFTQRLRRFGTSGSSEGAGGGRNGRAYLHGLSYGGGHTGPLYSLKRNVVGVGRHGNTYTSVYAGKRNAVHSCQATSGELFMPPGFELGDLLNQDLMEIHNELQIEDYARAQQLLGEIDATSKTDKLLVRYFKIVIEVEAGWRVECMSRIATVGDLYGVQTRIRQAREKFGDSIDRRLAVFEKRLKAKAAVHTLEAGRAYADACSKKDISAIRAVITDYPLTAYAHAARQHLGLAAVEGGKGQGGKSKKTKKGKDAKAKKGTVGHPLQWFLSADPFLNRFEYLPPK